MPADALARSFLEQSDRLLANLDVGVAVNVAGLDLQCIAITGALPAWRQGDEPQSYTIDSTASAASREMPGVT